ncbi:kynureninase [Prauserella marina]|uniref:Kynureninase n=1 Tax=Prauserella marina TaxID=530584 RepID=A0A1G6RE63_9PSEU|nr:kynureninase [Prauserella marina]PWV77011.1 kynureninase [Prauserella marina]SDD02345.1 kynureninase [Prauserella marina]
MNDPDGGTAAMALGAAESGALDRDAADPGHRDRFLIPPARGGRYSDSAYLAGNSLGLQPVATRNRLLEDLGEWARLGVEGHHDALRPWLPYHALLTEPAARLVGALPRETVVMNSLTVNLHLLMVSFYRPRGTRTRILIEDTAFPSDSYAVRSQAVFHGLDPDSTVLRARSADEVRDVLAARGENIALVLLGGVNYLTGELLDISAITAAGHAAGAVVGWDLAHAAGNVPLRLHDWEVDFAAWCSYKYLNAGPGAVAGAFVHERHLGGAGPPRLEGWWSTEEQTRFEMAPVSRPPASADAWQVSNPPILAMSPVLTSLRLFDDIGMDVLRARGMRLSGYLYELLEGIGADVLTPADPPRRGSQVSIRVGTGAAALCSRLSGEFGVVADAREPDVLRMAPTALYSTHHDCWRAAAALAALLPEVS